MIDFPASPVLNQTFTAPSGVMYKCTSAAPVVWTSMATQTSVPEAPIDGLYYARKDAAWAENAPFIEAPTDNGYYARRNAGWAQMTKAGAGLDQVDNTSDVNKPVSTAQANADSLRVLKTGDTMTGPLRLGDGTLASPSLSWSAEPGMGFYRSAAGTLRYAVGGLATFLIDSNTAAATGVQLLPRQAAGGSNIQLNNNAAGTADRSVFVVGIHATESYITSDKTGAGTQLPMSVYAPNLTFNANCSIKGAAGGASSWLGMYKTGAAANQIMGYKDNVIRWGIFLGEGADYFTIGRYNASGVWLHNPIQIRPSDGITQIGSDPSSYVGFRTGGLDFPAQAILPDWSATMMVAMRGTGWASWNTAQGWPTIQTSCAAGDKAIWWFRHAAEGGATAGYTASIGCYGQVNSASSIVLQTPGARFDFYTSGSAQKPGSSTWDSNSDVRIKENIADYTTGLAAVLALRPRTYTFKSETDMDTSVQHISFVAQEAKEVMPELVRVGKGRAGTIELDDMHSIGIDPLFYALVNAVKELSGKLDAALARIAQLEATP